MMIFFGNKLISSFINSIFKTHDELETIPIPELYNISFDTFQNNKFYDIRGFNGMNGFQLITPKQTIMIGNPLHLNMMHYWLYELVCQQIYSGQKLEKIIHILGKYVDCNISELNHISIRYVNDVREQNGKINVNNFCVIYGNLNNINSYQKRIILETISSIMKKGSNIQIYGYDSQKEIGIEDIMSITPRNDIVLDDDEKLLSSKESEYNSDISNYRYTGNLNYLYKYDDRTNSITPIVKSNIIDYERLSEYGIKILDSNTLNKMLINKVKIMNPGIYNDPSLIFKELSKEESYSK